MIKQVRLLTLVSMLSAAYCVPGQAVSNVLLTEQNLFGERLQNYQVFLRLWQALPMQARTELLGESQKFTLLVPSDQAFKSLPINWMMEMIAPENGAQLKEFVAQHILPGAHSAGDALHEQNLHSLSGSVVRFTRQKYALRVQDAYVMRPNVQLPMGYAHVIDSILTSR